VEPSPSKETINVRVMVPRTTFKGSPLTIFKINFTEGSNKPVSIMMAKYRIAKSSMMPVGASFLHLQSSCRQFHLFVCVTSCQNKNQVTTQSRQKVGELKSVRQVGLSVST